MSDEGVTLVFTKLLGLKKTRHGTKFKQVLPEIHSKSMYSFSHNHGSVENDKMAICLKGNDPIGDTPIFFFQRFIMASQYKSILCSTLKSL